MPKYLPAAAAATTGMLVGAAIVATRFVIGQTSPAALALAEMPSTTTLFGLACVALGIWLAQ